MLVVKNLPVNSGDVRASDLIPKLGRFPEGGHVNTLQNSCLENPLDREKSDGLWSRGSHRGRHG